MPYILDGKTISPDSAFTHDGIQYPAGWITRVSEETRQGIGLVWLPDTPSYDGRFWWGYDAGGNLISKDLDQLKESWTLRVKTLAGQHLSRTDWFIVRSVDPSSEREVSVEVLEERELIRQKSNEKEQAIAAAQSVEELAAYLNSLDFSSWSDEEPTEEIAGPLDVIESTDTGTIDLGEDSVTFSAGVTSGSISSGFGEDSLSI